MSEASALRPGQKVTLTGTVREIPGPLDEGCAIVHIDGDNDDFSIRSFPYSALTPVVEPEPRFEPGDVVRIDGVNHMLRTDGIRLGWLSPDVRTNIISGQNFSELWREGRVVVVYRKEADK